MGVAAGAYGDAVLAEFELGFVDADGVRRLPLGQGWNRRFEAAEPVRKFNWAKGGQGFAGWYFSATVGGHVGYESWLERDRLILLDRDPQVVGIASQPFWLHWHDGKRQRRYAPDHFVRLANGWGRVMYVRAGDRIDRPAAEAFEATERACAAADWEFVRVGEPDPVLMGNGRWLSRYRRRRRLRPQVAEQRHRSGRSCRTGLSGLPIRGPWRTGCACRASCSFSTPGCVYQPLGRLGHWSWVLRMPGESLM